MGVVLRLVLGRLILEVVLVRDADEAVVGEIGDVRAILVHPEACRALLGHALFARAAAVPVSGKLRAARKRVAVVLEDDPGWFVERQQQYSACERY